MPPGPAPPFFAPARCKSFAAYAAALDSGDEAALAAALARNVYGASAAPPEATGLARRAATVAAALDQARYEDFAAGRFRFPAAEGKTR